ncbi:MmcQ/YjbR family DNA-binding protein [Gottschalkiaceae bacterium SANA]|nr:MmcQ/YjbR family DNA-binding protein [Gottschalkiaceae bacterium SANA]
MDSQAMTYERAKELCLRLPGTSCDYPFDEVTLVFRVSDKMFALINESREPLSINLKCNPDEALRLRSMYEEVTAGYHMNKKHWNTIQLEGVLSDEQIESMIQHSYDLVFSKLKKADRERISKLSE